MENVATCWNTPVVSSVLQVKRGESSWQAVVVRLNIFPVLRGHRRLSAFFSRNSKCTNTSLMGRVWRISHHQLNQNVWETVTNPCMLQSVTISVLLSYTSFDKKKQLNIIYKVVQIWPGQTVTCLHTNSPGHIWTTLYLGWEISAPRCSLQNVLF
jgi:hypothetical protein